LGALNLAWCLLAKLVDILVWDDRNFLLASLFTYRKIVVGISLICLSNLPLLVSDVGDTGGLAFGFVLWPSLISIVLLVRFFIEESNRCQELILPGTFEPGLDLEIQMCRWQMSMGVVTLLEAMGWQRHLKQQ